jgi:hypothetical protein
MASFAKDQRQKINAKAWTAFFLLEKTQRAKESATRIYKSCATLQETPL